MARTDGYVGGCWVRWTMDRPLPVVSGSPVLASAVELVVTGIVVLASLYRTSSADQTWATKLGTKLLIKFFLC